MLYRSIKRTRSTRRVSSRVESCRFDSFLWFCVHDERAAPPPLQSWSSGNQPVSHQPANSGSYSWLLLPCHFLSIWFPSSSPVDISLFSVSVTHTRFLHPCFIFNSSQNRIFIRQQRRLDLHSSPTIIIVVIIIMATVYSIYLSKFVSLLLSSIIASSNNFSSVHVRT